MGVVTRSKSGNALAQQQDAGQLGPHSETAASTSDDTSQEVHDIAVRASANVPLRQRKRSKAEAVQKSTWQHMDYHAMPDWLQDNEFIRGFYRRPDLPLKKRFLSLFGIHNETGNVWTHLIGEFLITSQGAQTLWGGIALACPQRGPFTGIWRSLGDRTLPE